MYVAADLIGVKVSSGDAEVSISSVDDAGYWYLDTSELDDGAVIAVVTAAVENGERVPYCYVRGAVGY